MGSDFVGDFDGADVVEDTPVSIKDIEDVFGPRVAALVSDLTDVSKPEDGNRATRKELDRQHTAKASPDAKTVKLADLISNGAAVRACPHCMEVHGIQAAQLLEGVEAMNDKVMMEKIGQYPTVFTY